MLHHAYDVSRLSDDDLFLFNEGNHFALWQHLGAHLMERAGERGVYFAVWAPSAQRVNVIGDFNGWDGLRHPMRPRGSSGIWEVFIAGVGEGALYKYRVESHALGYSQDKADPMGQLHQGAPGNASCVWRDDYAWGDDAWMRDRGIDRRAPMSVYEVHLGSWRRRDDGAFLSYDEAADALLAYVTRMGFTHVELMPIMEHPFYGSWGYQATGFFAPTSRYGDPDGLKRLIDKLHQGGIGVLLDWVPSHFPEDPHGLARFDGTHLYEHADPRKGFHPDWKSCIFNYGRHEVRSFLISSALFWLREFHFDGLRVDAVASMLYLDYSRAEGEWEANAYGGRENLEAIDFLQRLNDAVHCHAPGALMVAEESTSWPQVTRPSAEGGLGFDMKWNMGWMHDTLDYLSHDPIHRRYHHDTLTFRMVYMYSEAYTLPLSHDEVVHGKRSLLEKMPGDPWQQRANLRLLFAEQHLHPGKKLLFMGGELGQRREWAHDRALDWELVEQHPEHRGLQDWVADLNRLHREQAALHAGDCDARGFQWICGDDRDQSVVAYARWTPERDAVVVGVLNLTPVVRHGYRLGLPQAGRWREALNSDAARYGGSGVGNWGEVVAEEGVGHQGQPHSVVLTLPPLGALFFVPAT